MITAKLFRDLQRAEMHTSESNEEYPSIAWALLMWENRKEIMDELRGSALEDASKELPNPGAWRDFL